MRLPHNGRRHTGIGAVADLQLTLNCLQHFLICVHLSWGPSRGRHAQPAKPAACNSGLVSLRTEGNFRAGIVAYHFGPLGCPGTVKVFAHCLSLAVLRRLLRPGVAAAGGGCHHGDSRTRLQPYGGGFLDHPMLLYCSGPGCRGCWLLSRNLQCRISRKGFPP